MKRTLKLSAVLILIAFTFSSKAQTSCIVADYPLNGDARDKSANALHGTMNGTTATTDRFGRPNSALKFNGTSDYVDLGTNADFAAKTLSVWFKADDFPANMGSVFTSDNANLKYGNIGLNVDNPGTTNRINFGVGANVGRYTTATKNTWYHYVLTVDASFVRFYINGQLFDSMPNNSKIHSNDGALVARLGCTRKTDRFFTGSIDEVKIYDCTLNKNDVKALYAYKPNSSCLAAHYPLDGNAKDLGSDALHGILHGTTPEKDRLGNANGALRFNGTSDYVQLGTDGDFAQKSLIVWFKPEEFPANMGVVFTTDNANLKYGGYGVNVDNPGSGNRINFGVGANVGRYSTMVKDNWYQYILTVDANYIRFYLNGKFIDSMANNSTLHSTDGDNVARLGCTRKTDRFFKGVIDDVKIYNCALNRSEVLSMFTTSVADIKQHSLKLYPNPAENTLTIENEGQTKSTAVSIIDATGRLVYSNARFYYGKSMDVSGLAKGIYLIHLIDDGKQVVLRFVKE